MLFVETTLAVALQQGRDKPCSYNSKNIYTNNYVVMYKHSINHILTSGFRL